MYILRRRMGRLGSLRLTRPGPRALVVTTVVFAALVLTGCVVFQSPPTATQQDVIGPVRITATICASEPDSGSPSHPGCPRFGNSSEQANAGGGTPTGQVLLGFSVPVGSASPTNFSSVAGESLSFTRSPSYEQQLTSLVPPPSGQVWVGYISAPYTLDPGPDGAPAKQSTVTVDFGLPRPASGWPFPGPFAVRPVVGARSVSSSLPADRPVSCGDSPFGGGFGSSTDCIDDPDQSTTQTNIRVATADLGITKQRTSVLPGRTGPVHFTARWASQFRRNAHFTLSASTSVPGGSATPTPSTLDPTVSGGTPVSVSLHVPAGTRPGRYTVTLRARLANGQTRTGTARVDVPDVYRPVLSALAIQPKSFAAYSGPVTTAASRGTTISFRLSKRAHVNFVVKRVVAGGLEPVGSFSFKGQPGVNSFHFTGYVNGSALTPGKYRLGAKPTDSAGRKGATHYKRFIVVK